MTPVRSPGGVPSAYDQTILADHPVAVWAMSGQAVEPDLTGNGHTGCYAGGAPAAAALPNADRAATFDGRRQYLEVASSPALSIPTTGQLTWEAWIRPDVLEWDSDYVNYLGKCSHDPPNCEWAARLYSTTNSEGRPNRLSTYVFNPTGGLGAGAFWQPDGGRLRAGQWLHVVGAYDLHDTPPGADPAYPGSVAIWLNSVPWNAAEDSPTGRMSQYRITPQVGSSPLRIGSVALDGFFAGAIGKVALYDSVLSPARITHHFHAMTDKRSPFR